MINNPHFKALLTFAHGNEGEGRSPVSSGYRSKLHFPISQDMFLGIFNFEEAELVFPGDNVTAEITLPDPQQIIEQLYAGLDFDFFENEKPMGHGTIVKVY